MHKKETNIGKKKCNFINHTTGKKKKARDFYIIQMYTVHILALLSAPKLINRAT